VSSVKRQTSNVKATVKRQVQCCSTKIHSGWFGGNLHQNNWGSCVAAASFGGRILKNFKEEEGNKTAGTRLQDQQWRAVTAWSWAYTVGTQPFLQQPRGQCWEHRLARESEGTLELDGSEGGPWPSSRFEFGRIMRGQVGSSRIESGSGIEDCMGDLL
jgi:hypothetical protein